MTPTIDQRIIDLVYDMRQAQKVYFDIITNRDGKFTQHQERRALQRQQQVEKQVDEFIAQYHEQMRAWYSAQGDYAESEIPEQFKTAF